MWADDQRDGLPVKYRWHPLQNFGNSIPCITPQTLANAIARVPCSNAANIRERKTWRKVNFAAGKILLGSKSPEKCIYASA